MTQPSTADAFAAELARRTGCEIAYDAGTLAAYSFDASNHRVPPRCVVFPRTVDDVVAVVDASRAEGVPVTSRGGGTNLTGSAIGPGVVIDHSRHRSSVLSVDPAERRAVVEPGVVLDDLQAIAARHGLRFGPDPSTHDRCTLGGMIGTNACGARALGWGTTAENTLTVDLVLADGSTTTLAPGSSGPLTDRLAAVRDRWLGDIRREVGRFGRQVSGYSMQYLLAENGFDLAKAYVGSEGTCAIVTSATVRLVPRPERRHLVVAGFGSLVEVAAVASQFAGLEVIAVEGMDDALVRSFDAHSGARARPELPAGSAWLIVEVGGDEDESRDRATTAARLAQDAGAREVRVVDDPAQQAAIWRVRERGAGLAARMPDGTEYWPGWEDAAVPAGRLADYLADFDVLLADYGRHAISYGHFGEGCVHSRVDHDLLSEAGRAAFGRFQHDAAALVARYDGSLSGEHGDGRSRSELLGAMYSEEMLAGFAAFKAAFDPGNLFNPGILVDPVAVDEALRLALSHPHTDGLGFGYPEDSKDFGKAIRRCVGVGACRSSSGGMCPSYRATLDERHSTRGRARILAEMLDGSLAADGWQSDATAEALDLCLMCKACSSECPVAVDMATYKAEFLHQRYRHRPRPRAHYALGWLPLWLAAARRVPRLANAVMGFRPAAAVLRRLGGIDPGRELPRLAAAQGVRRRARDARSATGQPSGDPVLLWQDTFTTAFGPEILADAAQVLRAAGYAVTAVGAGQCCGLTLLSTGQLGLARAVLARAVATLDAVAGSPPIVVLEPSCAAALRDDAVKLLDSDAARRVAGRVVGLAEALDGRDLPLQPEPGSAVVQFHCHQRATADLSPDLRLLERVGLTVSSVDEGCCGLAGNFGFEAGHLEVSRTCAEQSFLPYLRSAPAAGVLADGFSCRLQMAQLGADALGGRRPQHLAQLVAGRLTGPGT